MMNTKTLPLMSMVAVVVLLLSACGTSTTPSPIPPTETPVLGIEVEVEGTKLLVLAVNEKQEVQPYRAEEGFRFVEVVVQVLQGASPEDVVKWEVALKDAQGTLYEVGVRSTGIFVGGADQLSWTFLVPNEVQTFSLILPGGVSVDLTTFTQSK